MAMGEEEDEAEDKDCGEIASISREQAEMALRGFMPFEKIPAKHNAYMCFLRAALGETELPNIDSKWHSDFIQAALICKPLSDSMSSRFTASSSSKIFPEDFKAGIVQTSRPDVKLIVQPENIEIKMDTKRSILPWKPSELLCSRFKVQKLAIQEEQSTFPTASIINLPSTPSENFLRPSDDLFATIFGGTEIAKSSRLKPSASDFFK